MSWQRRYILPLGVVLVLAAGIMVYRRSSRPLYPLETFPPPEKPVADAPPPPVGSMPGGAPSQGGPAYQVDPGLAAMAEELNKPDNAPERDLEILSQIMSEYRRAMNGNPVGENTDITAALVGPEGGGGRFLPRNLPAIKGDQITDRWGTPYWFHSLSGANMEIRSAGPDKQLFTSDDVTLNQSPAGFGATPPQQQP